MHFVAESCTEDVGEFRDVCMAFIRSVVTGGHLVAAFMENMGRYQIGTGPQWPGFPVDSGIMPEAFAPYTSEMRICRIDSDRRTRATSARAWSC